MSGFIARIGWIGTSLQTLGKLVITDGFKSSVKTFKYKYSKIGYGMAVTTSLTACLMTWAKNESKDSTDKNKKITDNAEKIKKITDNAEKIKELPVSRIYDLEESVREKAIEMYKAHNSSFFSMFRTHKVPELKLNWDNVEIYPSEATFTDIGEKEEKAKRLIFKTVFHNKSKAHQKHNLKTELKRSSCLESSVTEGYTKGSKVELSLPIPMPMMNCAYVKPIGFSIDTVEGNRQVNEVSWVIEDFITVPGLTSITVLMNIKEKESNYEFTTKKGFKGHVKATFYNEKQEKIRSFLISTRTVIHEYIPQEMVEEGDRGITYIKIKGLCKFRYDVEREVIIY